LLQLKKKQEKLISLFLLTFQHDKDNVSRGPIPINESTDAAMAERAECVMLNKGPHIIETIKILDEILKSMQDYHHKKAPMLPPLKVFDPGKLDDQSHF
jgi:hypothetical protein